MWSLVAHPEVREWLYEIRKADRAAATLTVRAIQQVLSGAGPEEPRPLVERIKGSRVRELRELRPATGGHTEVKLLFAFVGDCATARYHDDRGHLVLLVAGENPGTWAKWYRDAVPLAERRYREYREYQEQYREHHEYQEHQDYQGNQARTGNET
jgi:hypothetical protein